MDKVIGRNNFINHDTENLIFLYTSCSYSQNSEVSNIFLQEFNYNSDECFNDKANHIVFFSKYYSDIQLKTGVVKDQDTIILNNLKEKESNYIYYIMRTHEKDTVKGIYNLKEIFLTDKYNTANLKKIVFKPLPMNVVSYECDDNVYPDVLLTKIFPSTAAILTLDKKNKKARLRLIKEDCSLAYNEEFLQKELNYSDDKNFLALKHKESFIFVFDRFLR